MYSVQCILNSVRRIVYSVQYIVNSVRRTVYTIRCTWYSVQSEHGMCFTMILYSVQCTIDTIRCTLYSIRRTVNGEHWSVNCIAKKVCTYNRWHCTMYNVYLIQYVMSHIVHYIMNIVQCTLYIIQYTVYNVRSTVYVLYNCSVHNVCILYICRLTELITMYDMSVLHTFHCSLHDVHCMI